MSSNVTAQTEIFNALNRDQYLAKVKMLDEFMARFNGDEQSPVLKEEQSDRKSAILMLFDLAKFKSKNDPGFLFAETFAQYVSDTGITLHFNDSLWYAKVKCEGKLQGKPTNFTLFLRVERREGDMLKWVISRAEGDFLLTSRDKKHNELFIMPNEHEQFFSSLRRVINESHIVIDDFAYNDYKSDPLSVFLTLVRTRLLVFDNVDSVEFVFQQVPGYIFTVKHFERESMNAGWLIDKCKKSNDEIVSKK